MKMVYTVRKCNKTKSTVVGNFETLADAEAAMVEHYRNTPKRGIFYYSIWREGLEVIGDVTYRSIDSSQKHVRYTREMLEAMI